MGEIPHTDGFVQHLIPRHFMELTLQRQGVCDDLKAVVQTAIVLAIGKGVLLVGDVQQCQGILVVLTSAVDLQLDTEEAGPGAIEDGTGLE